FGVFRATGAADAMIGFLLETFGHAPALLVSGGLLVFAFGSSTIGMAEEYLPFVPVLLALAIGLGFDAVTAVGILCCGYAIGYGAAVLNPFTVIIAQGIAGVQPGSGMGFRLVLTVVFLAIGIDHVLRYARRIKNDPSSSLVADIEPDPALTSRKRVPLTRTHVLSLAAIGVVLGVLVWGIKKHGWYFVEMGALFMGLTVVLGWIGRLGFDRTAKEFCVGAAELTTTALLIGFARTIQIVLNDGQVIDTIIHAVAQPLKNFGPHLA
ncbi:MAG: YfcC family protein, partial [Xanthomonadales bacterium]|nr:YfcC family protein [Xanthomonadales bacterium]NIT07649.1 YfcC family protein [Xanthomonadales bacterium]NIT33115.1 YfcC family protein [Xanthomonadales bacterium]